MTSQVVTYRCEHEFWGNSSAVDEPCGAFSGLVLMLAAILGHGGLDSRDQPLSFCMARASLFFLGIGTCVYHVMKDEWMQQTYTNRNLYDGLTLSMFAYCLFMLHLTDWLQAHLLFAACFAMLGFFFWVVSNDSILYQHLDEQMGYNFGMAVQYPIIVAVMLYIFVHVVRYYGMQTFTKLHWPMWVAFAVAITSWLLYEFACKLSTALFFCHALWHIAIAYVGMYAIILGVETTYAADFKRVERSVYWPRLVRVEPVESRELRIPKHMW